MTRRPTAVLMPGMLCTGRLWDAQRRSVEAAGFDSVDWVPSGSLMRRLADSAVDPSGAPVVLIGHSLGAIAAMTAAIIRPGAVSGLVLVSTTARAPRPDQRSSWTALVRDAEAGVTAPGEVAISLAPDQLSPRSPDRRQQLDVVAGMGAATDTQRLIADLEAQMTRTDLRAALRHVDVPALVVAGSDDLICPPARHREIADALPRAELVVIGGAGHMVPLEAPRRLADLIGGFLGALDRPDIDRPAIVVGL